MRWWWRRWWRCSGGFIQVVGGRGRRWEEEVGWGVAEVAVEEVGGGGSGSALVSATSSWPLGSHLETCHHPPASPGLPPFSFQSILSTHWILDLHRQIISALFVPNWPTNKSHHLPPGAGPIPCSRWEAPADKIALLRDWKIPPRSLTIRDPGDSRLRFHPNLILSNTSKHNFENSHQSGRCDAIQCVIIVAKSHILCSGINPTKRFPNFYPRVCHIFKQLPVIFMSMNQLVCSAFAT